jgi:glucosylceramidase
VAAVAVAACLGGLGGAPSSGAVTGADPYAVEVVQTSANLSERLTAQPGLEFGHTPPAKGLSVISVNDEVRYQRVTGFGAAMTDSSAWLIERELTASARTALMSELFGAGGLALDFVRVPIGASDFTVGGRPYSYDDLAPGHSDPRLSHFSIAHDRAYILPALTQALALDRQIELLASPWTPPAWMKANDSLDNVDDRGTLLGFAYGPWAAYIVKFIQAYARAGVPIAALTPQNEPGQATLYPGLNMSEASLAVWIKQDLAPALASAKLHVRLYGDDQGWSPSSVAFAQQASRSPSGSDLAGVAWHCYFGSPDVMSAFRSRAPRFDQIVDECSPGISAIPISEVVISSLRDWASTVALWNLALDQDGGPVQGQDTGCAGCSGLVTINDSTHTATANLALYQLGQASEFVEAGADRVASTHFVSYSYTKPGVNFVSAGLDDVAFVNPDGTRVLIAYNNSSRAIPFAVSWHGEYFTDTLPAKGMATFRWDSTAGK